MKELISKCLIAGALILGLGVIACENNKHNDNDTTLPENATVTDEKVAGNEYGNDNINGTDSMNMMHNQNNHTATGNNNDANNNNNNMNNSPNTSSKNNMSSPVDSVGGKMSRERMQSTGDTTYSSSPNYPR